MLSAANSYAADESEANSEATEELAPKSVAEVLLQMRSKYFTAVTFDYEVGGFRLMRRHVLSSALGIPDIDIAVDKNGNRYIPLARLLELFGPELVGDRSTLAFQAEFSPKAVIDLEESTVSIDGSTRELKYFAGISDITNSRDIFIEPSVASQLFNIELEWKDDLYEFEAITDNLLKIWRKKKRTWKGYDAELITDVLPERFGPAEPDRNALNYVQTRANLNVSARRSKEENAQDNTRANITTSQEFWGGLAGGRYELRFSQPNVSWEDGSGFDSGDQNLFTPREAFWTRTYKKNELTLGDSRIAINELVLPFTDFTGANFSGVVGRDTDDLDERTGFGNNSRFLGTRRFEGNAELGSTVTLFINDQEITTADVFEEPDSPPGFGRYEFDQIAVPSGNVVEIRIEIEEPNGQLIILDRSIVNDRKLRPAGQLSYIAGIGTDRDREEWDNQGVIGGARILYGVNSSFTVGATIGYQEGIGDTDFGEITFVPKNGDGLARTQRGSLGGEKASQIGVEFAAGLFSRVVLNGSFAHSEADLVLEPFSIVGDEQEEIIEDQQGNAYTLGADFFAHRYLRLKTQAFHYGDEYFNGANAFLRDREGYYVQLDSYPKFLGFTAVYGKVGDDVDDQLGVFSSETDFLSTYITTSSILPNTFLWSRFDYFDYVSPVETDTPSGRQTVPFKDDHTITTVGLRTKLYSFDIDAEITDGGSTETSDSLPTDISALFTNLTIPQLRTNGASSSSIAVTKRFDRHRFVLDLDGDETNVDERIGFTHYWETENVPGSSFLGAKSFRVETEFGLDESQIEDQADTKSFSNRINYYLDRRRRNRIGFNTRWDSQFGWTWTLDFNFTNIYALSNGSFRNISTLNLNPSAGSSQGKVFLDRNANGKRDKGEEGIAGIRVKSTGTPNGIDTDEHGEFLMSRRSNEKESIVYVDINSVPATLVPVHAKQTAMLERGLVTRTEFALAPMVSLTGELWRPALREGGEEKPISGARIELTDAEGNIVGESITASDGSYFFNSMPGEYELWVDPQTVHPRLIFNNPAFTLKVVGVQEYQELEFEPIYAGILNEAGAVTTMPSRAGRREIVETVAKPTTEQTAPAEAKGTAAQTAPLIESQNDTQQGPDSAVEQAEQAVGPVAEEPSPLDLTRPRIAPTPNIEQPDNDFVGISHSVNGLLLAGKKDGDGFDPLAGVRLRVIDTSGRVVEELETAVDGGYLFEAPAGAYHIAIDPDSVPIHYLYDEPAMKLKVPRTEKPQSIVLNPIYLNYLELKN